MNKPLLNIPLMIVLVLMATFTSAADKEYELSKFGNVIAILTGFIGESCDKPTIKSEVSEQTNDEVSE